MKVKQKFILSIKEATFELTKEEAKTHPNKNIVMNGTSDNFPDIKKRIGTNNIIIRTNARILLPR